VATSPHFPCLVSKKDIIMLTTAMGDLPNCAYGGI
jgi:hypothetical protein